MKEIEPACVEVLPPKKRPRPGPGRPRGARNRMTRQARDAIAMVFEGTGGVQAMINWVNEDKEHRRQFYLYIYPKLLPLRVEAEVSQVVAMISFEGVRDD